MKLLNILSECVRYYKKREISNINIEIKVTRSVYNNSFFLFDQFNNFSHSELDGKECWRHFNAS